MVFNLPGKYCQWKARGRRMHLPEEQVDSRDAMVDDKNKNTSAKVWVEHLRVCSEVSEQENRGRDETMKRVRRRM